MILWWELYCAALQDLLIGTPPAPRPEPVKTDRNVISMADERARRRRQAMRAL